jgi:hypothetical protein
LNVSVGPFRCEVPSFVVDIIRWPMSTEGYGSFYEHAKGRLVLYIPSDVRKDSQFPFRAGERVRIRIDARRLVVERAR